MHDRPWGCRKVCEHLESAWIFNRLSSLQHAHKEGESSLNLSKASDDHPAHRAHVLNTPPAALRHSKAESGLSDGPWYHLGGEGHCNPELNQEHLEQKYAA